MGSPIADTTDDGERYVHSFFGEFLDLVPTGTTLLDVGCSRGGFGASLKAVQPDRIVYGIEPTNAAQHAIAHLDHVVQGSYPEALPPEWQAFDVITFIDVLEHFVDPWDVLQTTSGLLAPNGKVLAFIPNIRCLSASGRLLVLGQWKYKDTGLLDRTHLRFFTRSGIEALFAESGYTIEDMVPMNPLFPHSAAMKVLVGLGRPLCDLVCRGFAVLASPR